MTTFNYFLNGSVKALRLNATINQLSLTIENIGEDVNSSFYHLRTNIKCTIMNWRHVALSLKEGTHPKDFDKQKEKKGGGLSKILKIVMDRGKS